MKSHLKRLRAPRSWKIKRKGVKFVMRPEPGAYQFKLGLPLAVILRDTLCYAKTKREVKNILLNQEVYVDGVRRKRVKFLVGIMSIISIPKLKENFRVVLNKKGQLVLVPVGAEETSIKLCKISRKNLVKKKTQLGLFDGRTILTEKGDFKVGDSLIIKLPEQSIKKHLKFEKGSLVYFISGKHIGETATIEKIEGKNVFCKTKTGEKFETRKDYVLVIGKDKPEIVVEK